MSWRTTRTSETPERVNGSGTDSGARRFAFVLLCQGGPGSLPGSVVYNHRGHHLAYGSSGRIVLSCIRWEGKTILRVLDPDEPSSSGFCHFLTACNSVFLSL